MSREGVGGKASSKDHVQVSPKAGKAVRETRALSLASNITVKTT